ncbi:hypothetical protein Patl1_19460 [Pistacia atlantica]|uniref:Uncharacterized protein n=1 Tax=Pistacia atlantica TaxID=434234 RepID=A0ACC1BZS4_9ROSI|nr:hypothetical protein Patl1_19460 [Pistacia atlantica]
MRHQALTFSNFPTLLICLLVSLLISFESSESQNLLQRGSSLSVEDSSHVYLTSPDKTFTCGFYSLGENAHWFSIWFTNSKDTTVVWMANRERPVNGKGSKVSLQKNGDLVLKDVDGSVIWTTNTSSTGADRAELLDSGNLVLKDIDGNTLWQSFDFPTDTLLPNQPFTWRQKTKYNSSGVAVLDGRGHFLSSDKLQFSALDMGDFRIKRRLTIDYDGNLRLYSLNNVTGLWMVSWLALLQQCQVHGVCGRNGICTYAPHKPKCSCPPEFESGQKLIWICIYSFVFVLGAIEFLVLLSENFLGWKERLKIALGTAKGLAYLHHECLEWVIHCDVKPENILLDSEFEPKIADFGLAKLSQRGKRNSEVSRIRGTKGDMAPEGAMNLPITSKVDVYSYGVVILEIVKGIRVSYPVAVEDGDDEQEAELTRNVS